MKTRVIVAVVVMVHCVVLASILMQGCRSTGGQSMSPSRHDISAPTDEMDPVFEDVPVTETQMMEYEPVVPLQIETTDYIVRKGDTLGAIARHYDVRVGDIMALNGLENANKLRIGQEIKLPGIHDVSSLPPVAQSTQRQRKTETSKPVVAGSGSAQTYMIKKGDSLSTIAKSFGVSVKALKEANSMTSDRITAGRKLTIPGNAAVAAPTEPVAPMGLNEAPAPITTPGPTIGADVTNGTVMQPDAIDTSDLDLDGGATADAAPVPMAEGDYKMHTVSADEDLSTIAIRWGVSEESVRSLNGVGSEPLKEGQVLKIPAH